MRHHTSADRSLHINHVHIIGRVSSQPRIAILPGGRKVAQFSLVTKETYLDENGSTCIRQNWHRMTAWGRWVTVIEELCTKDMQVAVEGKLVSRFYRMQNGKRQMVSEIEVNDLVIL